MSTETVKVIGLSEPIDTEFRQKEVFCANNKLEMAQEKEKAKGRGMSIVEWYAQTKQGCKMLGTLSTFEKIEDAQVKHIKTVTCPICKGQGGKLKANGWKHGCPVCDGSGITKNNYWNNWRDWQLEEMRKEFR